MEAYYFAYAAWPTIAFIQSLSTYTLVWMAMDRFLGVCLPWAYRKTRMWPNFMWIRSLVTVMISVLLHVLMAIEGRVIEKSTGCGYGLPYGTRNVHHHFQEEEEHRLHIIGHWYGVFQMFCVKWLPCSLLLVFNTGLVIAVMKGQFRLPDHAPDSVREASNTVSDATNPTNSHVMNRREKNLVLTLIAMASSSILLKLPITIALSLSSTAYDCCNYDSRSVLFDLANIFQLFEPVLNIFFFMALNSKFRMELKSILEHLKRKQCPGEDMSNRVTESEKMKDGVQEVNSLIPETQSMEDNADDQETMQGSQDGCEDNCNTYMSTAV